MSTSSAPPAPSPHASDRAAKLRELRTAFEAIKEPLPNLQTTGSYRFAVGMLAVTLILMTIGFAAGLGFLLWLVMWHGYQAVASLSDGYFLLHVPMALLALVLLIFILKPLFLRLNPNNDRIITLEEKDQPALFEFVRRLALAAGAPIPRTIEVDCDANAGAFFVKGWRGVLKKELGLRIGLPLVSTMTVRELAGVLGHELGHFTQRGGMISTYFIRSLNFFFLRIVFERDRLDAFLDKLRERPQPAARAVYWVAFALIEPARGVLWLAMLVNDLLTSHTLRRMEFAADNVEALIAGSSHFEQSNRIASEMGLIAQHTHSQLEFDWIQRRLPDDLPKLIADQSRWLVKERAQLAKFLEGLRTGVLDTHPCHTERVRNAVELGAPGVITCSLPAVALFTKYSDLCERASTAFFKDVTGEQFRTARFVSTEQMCSEWVSRHGGASSMNRMFRGHQSLYRINFPSPEANTPLEDVPDTVAEMGILRARLLETPDNFDHVVEQLDIATEQQVIANAQLSLCQLFGGFSGVPALRAEALALKNKADRTHLQHIGNVGAFEDFARHHFTLGLRLLYTPQVARKVKNIPDVRADADRLLRVVRLIEKHYPDMRVLQELGLRLRVIVPLYNTANPYPPLHDELLRIIDRIMIILDEMRKTLNARPYPFEHAQYELLLGDWTIEAMPDRQNLVDVFEKALTACDRCSRVVYRAIAKLTEYGEAAMQAAGLELLTDPDFSKREISPQEKAYRRKNTSAYWLGYSGRAAAGLLLLGMLLWWSWGTGRAEPPRNHVPSRSTARELGRGQPVRTPPASTPPAQQDSPPAVLPNPSRTPPVIAPAKPVREPEKTPIQPNLNPITPPRPPQNPSSVRPPAPIRRPVETQPSSPPKPIEPPPPPI